ncbi:MAG: sel1 repeat family protein [Opitutae bacterium]|nr:sel1 repeat family protein [Opitutae bacterium]
MICLLVGAAARADESPDVSWPDVPPAQRAEMAFELRMRVICETKSDAAGEKFLRQEFARDPRPAVKAFMVRMYFYGKDWGMPLLVDAKRGRQLAEEAIAEGSAAALDVYGRAIAEGLVEGKSRSEAIAFIRRGVERGVPRCMARLGWYHILGWNVPVNIPRGIHLVRRAAELGNPGGLVDIAAAYEEGTAAPGASPPLALEFYRQAWRFNSAKGRDALKRLAATNENAKLLYATELARTANGGRWMMLKRGKEYLVALESMNPTFPDAMTELGLAHAEGYYAKRDLPLARKLLGAAVAGGSQDARFVLARLRLEGIGCTREPAALEEIHTMADAGNVRAAGYYGYVHYWGASVVAGLKRDEATAFRYIRLAAQKGDLFAVHNLAVCYANGVGTREDYLLAAKLYWESFEQGESSGSEKARRYLNFVKE